MRERARTRPACSLLVCHDHFNLSINHLPLDTGTANVTLSSSSSSIAVIAAAAGGAGGAALLIVIVLGGVIRRIRRVARVKVLAFQAAMQEDNAPIDIPGRMTQ